MSGAEDRVGCSGIAAGAIVVGVVALSQRRGWPWGGCGGHGIDPIHGQTSSSPQAQGSVLERKDAPGAFVGRRLLCRHPNPGFVQCTGHKRLKSVKPGKKKSLVLPALGIFGNSQVGENIGSASGH